MPKAQRTKGIEYFDSFSTSSSKSFSKLWNLGQTLTCIFGKGQKIQKTTLTNPCNNLEKLLYHFRQIHVTSKRYIHVLRNPRNNLKKSLYQFWQIHVTTKRTIHVSILTNPCNNFNSEIHVTTLKNPIWTKFNKSSDRLIDKGRGQLKKKVFFRALPE